MNWILKIHPDASVLGTLWECIKKIITHAEKEVANVILKLPVDVTVLVDTDSSMIDPNIGVDGYTDNERHAQLSIDPIHKDLHDDEIFAQ